MNHQLPEEEITLRAALYALGVLSEDEARAFQIHLDEGCKVCQEEVRSYQRVVEILGFSAPSAEPPATVRQRLFEEVAKPALGRSLTIRANEGEWIEKWEGVFIKRLFKDKDKGTVTTLYKMLPGASLPRHRHIGAEECLVLEGDYHINGEVLGAGDYHCALPDSVDESLFTIGGTMFLIVSPERYAAV